MIELSMAEQKMSKQYCDFKKLFFEGDDYYSAALDAIDGAQKEVIIESYIFEYDEIGKMFLDALIRAKQRGVEVLLLVDGVGSFLPNKSLSQVCRSSGIRFRVYHPIPDIMLAFRDFSRRGIRRYFRLWKVINKRNHRKLIIIDESIAFFGSFNITRVHSKNTIGPLAWRDTGAVIQGSEAGILKNIVMKAWNRSSGRSFGNIKSILRIKVPKIRLSVPSRIITNHKLFYRYRSSRQLKKLIQQAKERILITNPYFIPRRSIIRSLQKAAGRGVYVGICVPAKSDVHVVKMVAQIIYRKLLRKGVHIYEYQNRMIHAKTLVIDNVARIGSHNFNHRSFSHDLEIELETNSHETVQQLINQWDKDISESKSLNLFELDQMSIGQRVIRRIFYWLRFWI